MPTAVNIGAPLFMAFFAMFTSQSGRSSALVSLGFVVLVLVGGRSRRTMVRISKYFWMLCCTGIVGVFVAYNAYKTAATRGWLGEDARVKYELQSQGEDSIGRLILGGRAEAFVGLLACRDKPIVGWGPWAIDTKGYFEEFMSKYGTMEDVIALQKTQQRLAMMGVRGDRMIKCHAYITEFWVWYGIFGLMFWIYVIFVLLRYLRQDCFIVPQWFAWLACAIPGMFWAIFFSPFQDRFGVSMLLVACLMVRAVRRGTFMLPFEMVQEIEKAEKR